MFDRLNLWNTADSKSLWESLIPYPKPQNNPILMTPDKKYVITAHDIFDARDGKVATNSPIRLPPDDYRRSSAPLGRLHRVSYYPAKSVADMESWAATCDSEAHSAGFSPDSTLFFIKHGDSGFACVRNAETNDVTFSTELTWPQRDGPYLARFSLDNRLVVTADSDSTARIWDLSGVQIGLLAPEESPLATLVHRTMVSDACFSTDGNWVATGTSGGEVRIWDAVSGRPISPLLPTDSPVLRVAFNVQRTRIFVACASGTVMEWSLEAQNGSRFTWALPDFYGDTEGATQLSPDGKVLITHTTTNSSVMVWSLTDGSLLLPPVFAKHYYGVRIIDGYLIVPNELQWSSTNLSLGGDATTCLFRWNVVNLLNGETKTHSLSNWFAATDSLSVSELATESRWICAHQPMANEIFVVNVLTGGLRTRLHCPSPIGSTAQIRPDGNQVVAFDKAGRLVVWNLPSVEPSLMLEDHFGPNLSYSPRGRWLLGGCCSDRMKDAHLFQDVPQSAVLPFHNGNWSIPQNFSPDESWGLFDVGGQLRARSTTNSAIASTELSPRNVVIDALFSADGKRVFSVGSDWMLRSWSIPHGEFAMPPLRLPAKPMKLWTTSDTHGLLVLDESSLVHTHNRYSYHYGEEFTLRFWELPKAQRPVSDWLALARFFAKRRGEHDNGQSATAAEDSRVVRQTSRDQWLALRAKHPEVFTVSTDEIDAWHRHEAWRCESRQDWSNAVTHLSALLETHPDSGDFLPRRAAAHVALAESLLSLAPGFNPVTKNGATPPAESAASRPPEAVKTAPDLDGSRTGLTPGTNERVMTSRMAATNHWERALEDYSRTLAWVDRFPAIAKEGRLPFVEKRREVHLKLGRTAEAAADELEMKTVGGN